MSQDNGSSTVAGTKIATHQIVSSANEVLQKPMCCTSAGTTTTTSSVVVSAPGETVPVIQSQNIFGSIGETFAAVST